MQMQSLLSIAVADTLSQITDAVDLLLEMLAEHIWLIPVN
jgi:hypothetical protein